MLVDTEAQTRKDLGRRLIITYGTLINGGWTVPGQPGPGVWGANFRAPSHFRVYRSEPAMDVLIGAFLLKPFSRACLAHPHSIGSLDTPTHCYPKRHNAQKAIFTAQTRTWEHREYKAYMKCIT